MKAIGAVLLILFGSFFAAYALLQLFRGEPLAVWGVAAVAGALFWWGRQLEEERGAAAGGVPDDRRAAVARDAEPPDVPSYRGPRGGTASSGPTVSPRLVKAISGLLAAPSVILIVGGLVNVKLWLLFVGALAATIALAASPRQRPFAGGWIAGTALLLYAALAFGADPDLFFRSSGG